MKIRTGIGQDSHRFLDPDHSKPCIIGGIIFDDTPGFQANSDGDVVFHAICNAITSLSGVLVLGGIADTLCSKDGITDSSIYLKEAIKTLGRQKISHVAISIEGMRPKIKPYLQEVRENIAATMNLDITEVCITATTGEGLTDFGCGDGVQALCIITSYEEA
jgi:2-C-methyl-D-erythritol 2,4-cyclodiphosphate synthase